jgi:hypothetical protein
MSFALAHQSKSEVTEGKSLMPAKSPSQNSNLIKTSDDSIIHLQHTIDNQTFQRPVHSTNNAKGFDFGKIRIQPKLKVSQPEDEYEQEADKVAEQVMRMSAPGPIVPIADTKEGQINRKCTACEMKNEEEEKKVGLKISRKPASGCTLETNDHVTAEINNIRSSSGTSLDTDNKEFMESRFGYDFSSVRIHTGESAARSANSVNALAYAVGNDIVFGEGQYQPKTIQGRRLLAHELTHVVQQYQVTDKAAQREMIHRTTVGNVLDEFFSPFSSPTLWVMPENDNYTRIVRRWQPVIDAVNEARADLHANCANWSASHMTDASWRPGMTKPPVTDPNAHGKWVPSPPGTDPTTCKNAFIPYTTSKASRFIPLPGLPPLPPVQTFELYTCAIGSFGIYVTVNSIDCAAQTAQMKIWMYNTMDQTSFARFASHWAFSLSKMQPQYMWWNWTESWGSSSSGGGSGGGGPGKW